jgi:DnaJ-class molecular chaperone
MIINYYQILGLKNFSSAQEIKSAYPQIATERNY